MKSRPIREEPSGTFAGFLEIDDVISKDPSILHASADKSLAPSLSLLKSMLRSTAEVAKFLKKVFRRYVKCDLGRSLVPNVDLLTNCGVDKKMIIWLIHYVPRLLLHDPENMKRFFEKAELSGSGAGRNTKMYIHCVRIVASIKNETWELKKNIFRDLGFFEDDISRVVRKPPPTFLVSKEKVKMVAQVLATGSRELHHLKSRCYFGEDCKSSNTRKVDQLNRIIVFGNSFGEYEQYIKLKTSKAKHLY